jgi:hypothetical protein
VRGVSPREGGSTKPLGAYLSPEQARGEGATEKSDVYAACLILREMLTGEPAFVRGTASDAEWLARMAAPRFRPVEAVRPGVPAMLRDAIRRGLEPESSKRSATAHEIVGALKRAIDGDRARRELVQVMERARRLESPGVSEVSPERGVGESVPPAEVTIASRTGERRPKRRGARAWLALLALAFAALPAARLFRHPPATAARPRPEREKSSPEKWTTIVEKTSSTGGRVLPAPSSLGRHVTVDGQSAGDLPREGLVVPCGLHTIRVGAGVPERAVNVPCGGAVVLP